MAERDLTDVKPLDESDSALTTDPEFVLPLDELPPGTERIAPPAPPDGEN